MNQIAEDLRKNHAAMGRDVSVYSVAADEIDRLEKIIVEHLEHSADGVLLCTHEGLLYCWKCGSEVMLDFDLCYCWECGNPDCGDEVPLPLSYSSCFTKRPEQQG